MVCGFFVVCVMMSGVGSCGVLEVVGKWCNCVLIVWCCFG